MATLTKDQQNGLSAIGSDRSTAGVRRNARQLLACEAVYGLALTPLTAWQTANPVVTGEPAWKAKARLAVAAAIQLSSTAKTTERAAITARLADN